MKIILKTGKEDLANLYLAKFDNGQLAEFVESVQPPYSRKEKWVLIVSTLYGCPVKCRICDAGIQYKGVIDENDIFAQIDFLIKSRYTDCILPMKKFKIQFSRMGEPSFNKNVLNVLNKFPDKYHIEGFIPSLSTIAPLGTEGFFDELLIIKRTLYQNSFQLQFSIHSTDKSQRDWLIPCKKWNFKQISEYGQKFYHSSGKKITLNFAVSHESIIDPVIISNYFDYNIFIIKLTPVNPTYNSFGNKIESVNYEKNELQELAIRFRQYGFDTIVSIGEQEENYIGDNCGQLLIKHLESEINTTEAYSYQFETI